MKDLNDEMWDYFDNLLREMSLEYHTHVTEDTYTLVDGMLSTRSLLIDVVYRLNEFTEGLFTDWVCDLDEESG